MPEAGMREAWPPVKGKLVAALMFHDNGVNSAPAWAGNTEARIISEETVSYWAMFHAGKAASQKNWRPVGFITGLSPRPESF